MNYSPEGLRRARLTSHVLRVNIEQGRQAASKLDREQHAFYQEIKSATGEVDELIRFSRFASVKAL